MTESVSHSPEETVALAKKLGAVLRGGEVIAYFGGLGMGKTTFTSGLALGMGINAEVSSPTFSLVHDYGGNPPLYHFDMYRINTYDDLYSTGFFDYIDTGVLIIEWSENIENALPDDYIRIEISHGDSENERIIIIEGIEI